LSLQETAAIVHPNRQRHSVLGVIALATTIVMRSLAPGLAPHSPVRCSAGLFPPLHQTANMISSDFRSSATSNPHVIPENESKQGAIYP
jgi:hypothetical protein